MHALGVRLHYELDLHVTLPQEIVHQLDGHVEHALHRIRDELFALLVSLLVVVQVLL